MSEPTQKEIDEAAKWCVQVGACCHCPIAPRDIGKKCVKGFSRAYLAKCAEVEALRKVEEAARNLREHVECNCVTVGDCYDIDEALAALAKARGE